jgi:hypothetical protein
MSIQTRLEEAQLLLEHGRYEGALLCVLIALAATAQRRFPRGKTKSIQNPKNKMGDGEAFQTFVTQEIPNVIPASDLSFELHGKQRPLGEVLYKWMRCHSVHEAELAPEIEFVPDVMSGTFSMVSSKTRQPTRIIFTYSLILILAEMVAQAPENVDLPSDLIDAIRKSLGWVT